MSVEGQWLPGDMVSQNNLLFGVSQRCERPDILLSNFFDGRQFNEVAHSCVIERHS